MNQSQIDDVLANTFRTLEKVIEQKKQTPRRNSNKQKALRKEQKTLGGGSEVERSRSDGVIRVDQRLQAE